MSEEELIDKQPPPAPVLDDGRPDHVFRSKEDALAYLNVAPHETDAIAISNRRAAAQQRALREELADLEFYTDKAREHIERKFAQRQREIKLAVSWLMGHHTEPPYEIRRTEEEFLRALTSQTKHGPDGRGAAGPCRPDCLKCEAEARLAMLRDGGGRHE